MNSDYREVNQNEQEEQQMYLETPIYKEAVSHFRTTQYYFISFNSLKIGCGFALLYMNHEQTDLNYWILAIMFHAFVMIIAHKNHLKYLTMNKRILAYKLDQIVAGPIVDQVIESRRLNILSRQIKLEIAKSTIFGKWCCRIITIIYQLIFGYGVYLFCIYYSMRSAELMNQYYFLCAILIISLYQYIDLYLILVLAILGSPFLLIFGCYYCANLFGKEQQRNEIRTRLQAIKYKPNLIEGEQECCICRCPYELNEEVVVLKCSKLHHYHETCIMSWININNTCPFCRKSI
ncbi:unnamed protein product [Paramecium octaurelia]|uniref:RING-type domain-containing protein n=1 Tax=Paramecium octaurelia TaxID=43137 RepID=A0A8S1WHV1_PAROT|nr:unnamed protein product [Paramecium octaurelia]